jgi:hypothetical protein
MPDFTYNEICQKAGEVNSEPVFVYGETQTTTLPNEDAGEGWAAELALRNGMKSTDFSGCCAVYMSPNWVPFAGLGDTVSYRKYLWADDVDVDNEEATPIGELVMTEEPVKPTYTPATAVPAEMHWAGLAMESLNELCDRAEDALSQLRRNLFVDVSGLSLAFGDAMKKIGRAAAEREANKRATTTR